MATLGLTVGKLVFSIHLLIQLLSVVSSQPPDFDHGVDLPTTRPLIIAHRGASGELPEHTIPSYQLGVEQGADIIECDVCVTRDLHLVCLHESWMEGTTDIGQIFPEERMNTYFIDDILLPITDYFSVDFTLAELKTVHMRQRYGSRNPNHNGLYTITSLQEYIEVAQNASRPVGIYPETKHPEWVNSLDIIRNANTTFEDLLLQELGRHGYNSSRDPCFIQSFSEDSVRYLSNRTELPLIMLMTPLHDDSDESLADLATFCYGIGPHKELVVSTDFDNQIDEITDLVERAHRAGLRVHPFTLRNENSYLAWDYGLDYINEYDEFFNQTVDGIFTDFPRSYRRFLDVKYATHG